MVIVRNFARGVREIVDKRRCPPGWKNEGKLVSERWEERDEEGSEVYFG